MDEHPNELYRRLITTNSKLKGLHAGYTDEQLKMKFVSAIEEQGPNGIYAYAIQQYRGKQFEGNSWSLETLSEFLTHIFDTQRSVKQEEPEMRGMLTATVNCNNCGKSGHSSKNCWIKYPEKINIKRKLRNVLSVEKKDIYLNTVGCRKGTNLLLQL